MILVNRRIVLSCMSLEFTDIDYRIFAAIIDYGERKIKGIKAINF